MTQLQMICGTGSVNNMPSTGQSVQFQKAPLPISTNIMDIDISTPTDAVSTTSPLYVAGEILWLLVP